MSMVLLLATITGRFDSFNLLFAVYIQYMQSSSSYLMTCRVIESTCFFLPDCSDDTAELLRLQLQKGRIIHRTFSFLTRISRHMQGTLLVIDCAKIVGQTSQELNQELVVQLMDIQYRYSFFIPTTVQRENLAGKKFGELFQKSKKSKFGEILIWRIPADVLSRIHKHAHISMHFW